MVDARTSSWEEHKFTDLNDIIVESRKDKQYLIICDKQGSVNTFFNYQYKLCDLEEHL